MRNDLVENVVMGKIRVNMRWINVAGDDGERVDVFGSKRAGQFREIPDFDFIKGPVFDVAKPLATVISNSRIPPTFRFVE